MNRKQKTTDHLRVVIDYYVSKIRQVGIGWTLRWFGVRVLKEIGWLLLLPIALVLHWYGYRRVPVNMPRLGHLAAEVDAFLKEKALGRFPNRRWFLLAPRGQVANPCLLDYWRDHIGVVSTPWQCMVLSAMSHRRLMTIDTTPYMYAPTGVATYYGVQTDWGKRPPLLQLKPDHQRCGRKILLEMGVPLDAWFVAVHVREPGYALADEAAHCFRNSSFELLLPAIADIRRRGGWVVRMGDPSMKPMPAIDGVIDYAHHPARSDWMDVFLCAECRFFLGNTSGLFILSTVFGVPCALANMVPMSHAALTFRDIWIPKLIWSEAEGRYLTFPEIFSSSVANFTFARLYKDMGLRVDENTEEDIRALVGEMLDRLERGWHEEREDEALQASVKALFTPKHYGFGTSARWGSAFLRKYRFLLDAENQVGSANNRGIESKSVLAKRA